uniref:Uncharacterized protein n=1 Tax=Chromera velia CCMP2878 TaxID=1169474 RepID=A0A0G4FS20_9ALVE|eukprot:Cvel_3676.t1-p1 / transcript=Cvel_3676.t1 / gene=Cvel_3676 / organism=Chromera_velia_CCMP2878 / gene_product=Exosome complex component rrp45, putative / transcript_product=Exosome complex component rrp45, putative / location=Cvel_scaffold152:117022-121598(+) / protein_length=450 / sequence_SO=supercontig / SO=protein_coding / is_pseudo=false
MVTFGNPYGQVEVCIGHTRVMCVITGEIVEPHLEKPGEGFLSFHTDLSPMASKDFMQSSANETANDISFLIDRVLRGSRAVDTESLCILSGKKVWSVRADIRVLDDDGNLHDACGLAALAGLVHFKKRDASFEGGGVNVHSEESREPVPLSIHHLPLLATFAHFETEEFIAADPTRVEESLSGGLICIAVNQFGELCGIHRPGGVPLSMQSLRHCIQAATERGKALKEILESALLSDKKKREAARKDIRQRYTEPVIGLGSLPAVPLSLQSEGGGEESMSEERETKVPRRAVEGLHAAAADSGLTRNLFPGAITGAPAAAAASSAVASASRVADLEPPPGFAHPVSSSSSQRVSASSGFAAGVAGGQMISLDDDEDENGDVLMDRGNGGQSGISQVVPPAPDSHEEMMSVGGAGLGAPEGQMQTEDAQDAGQTDDLLSAVKVKKKKKRQT